MDLMNVAAATEDQMVPEGNNAYVSTNETPVRHREQWSLERKLELVRQFKENEGGRNARAFAAANGVHEQTFYNWLLKFDKNADFDDPETHLEAGHRSRRNLSFPIARKVELVTAFKEEGGRNARAFAAAHGVNEQTFYNWVSKFDKGLLTPLDEEHNIVGEDGEVRVAETPGKQRRRRNRFNAVSLPIEKKLELIRAFYAEGGQNVRAYANAHGINEQTFYGWIERYERGTLNEAQSLNPQRKRARKSQFPEVEEELLQFVMAYEQYFNEQRQADGGFEGASEPVYISRTTLQAKAAEIALRLVVGPAGGVVGDEDDDEAHEVGVGAWPSSSSFGSWLRRFIQRHNLGHRIDPDNGAPALPRTQLRAIEALMRTLPQPTVPQHHPRMLTAAAASGEPTDQDGSHAQATDDQHYENRAEGGLQTDASSDAVNGNDEDAAATTISFVSAGPKKKRKQM